MTKVKKTRWDNYDPNITVIKLDTQEEIIIHISPRKWCLEKGINYSAFNDMLNGKVKSSCGYALKGVDTTKRTTKGTKRNPQTEETKIIRSKKLLGDKYKNACIVDIHNGKEYCMADVPYLKSFAREHEISYKSLIGVLNKTCKSCNGKFVLKERWEELQKKREDIKQTPFEKVVFFDKEYYVTDWLLSNHFKEMFEPLKFAKGIYAIFNIKNGKFYIGSSVNIGKRWWEHRDRLGNNEHHCIHLQRAWTKYGEEKFVFIVLEQFDKINEEDLVKIEKKYIDQYFDNGKNCYNASKETERPDNTEQKIRVRQIDMETGNVLRVFDSIASAAKELKLYGKNGDLLTGGIRKCCMKRARHCSGYKWEYDEEEKRKEIDNVEFQSKQDVNKKRIAKLSEDGLKIEAVYDSLVDAAKENGIKTYHQVSMVCSGRRKATHGIVFKYLEETLEQGIRE